MPLEEKLKREIKQLHELADTYARDGAFTTANERRSTAHYLERILKAHERELLGEQE